LHQPQRQRLSPVLSPRQVLTSVSPALGNSQTSLRALLCANHRLHQLPPHRLQRQRLPHLTVFFPLLQLMRAFKLQNQVGNSRIRPHAMQYAKRLQLLLHLHPHPLQYPSHSTVRSLLQNLSCVWQLLERVASTPQRRRARLRAKLHRPLHLLRPNPPPPNHLHRSLQRLLPPRAHPRTSTASCLRSSQKLTAINGTTKPAGSLQRVSVCGTA
jgi:hypothetical protein